MVEKEVAVEEVEKAVVVEGTAVAEDAAMAKEAAVTGTVEGGEEVAEKAECHKGTPSVLIEHVKCFLEKGNGRTNIRTDGRTG